MESTTEDSMPAHLSNNTVRLYYELDNTMMLAHREETEEADKKAVSTARALVEDADVPLLIRARACMILGCSGEVDFLAWVEEGVRTAELAISVAKEAGDVEKTLLQNCKEVLEGAKTAQAARQAKSAGQGKVEDEEE